MDPNDPDLKALEDADLPPLVRWRLILGESADLGLGSPGMSGRAQAADAAMDWLYSRDGDLEGRDIAPSSGTGAADDRHGGTGPSVMSVPDWLNDVHKLFPRETIERLEGDAVERYGIHEVVTNPEVLERIEPNETLLRAVMQTKHLMNPDVLELARKLVAKVVKKLVEKLAREVRAAFSGTPDRRRRSLLPMSRNFDALRTLKINLKNYDPQLRRVVVETPWFFSRVRRSTDRWQVILVVDESGSMMDSVIHSAVTAACLWGLPAVKTHLVIFDTEVVDLTEDVTDPVETLMKVQLGGGTDIAKAVGYVQELIEVPRRSIVVLVTDFYEGGDRELLVRRVQSICSQGSYFLGLAALDNKANPCYDRDLARRLVDVGAHVGAMTPGELANWIAEKVRR